jgi:hypothetical protein
VHRVDLARVEGVDPLGDLDDRPELDRVEVGQLPTLVVLGPVVGVLVGHELLVGDPFLQLERAGADQLVGAVRRVVELALGHHPDPAAAVEVGVERHPRLLHRDRHGHRVDQVDRRDVGEGDGEQEGLAGGVGAPVGVEVVLDDLAGQVGAVVELDAVTDLDRPHRVVGVGLDRLGEPRLVLAVGIGPGQRVVDRAGDHDARDGQLGLGEAPAVGRLGLEAVDQLAPRLGGALVGRGTSAAA